MSKILKYDAGKDYKDQLDCSCEKRRSVKRVKEEWNILQKKKEG
jgi:hypothetical protein